MASQLTRWSRRPLHHHNIKKMNALWLLVVFVWVALVLVVLGPVPTAAARPSSGGGVRVSLEASAWASDAFWPAREAAEFLFQESPSSTSDPQSVFWTFFHQLQLCTTSEQCAALSAADVETALFEFIQSGGNAAAAAQEETQPRVPLLADAEQRALKLALAYRTYLPAVVSHSGGEPASAAVRDACSASGNKTINAWGLLNGVTPVCSAEELTRLLQRCSAAESDETQQDSSSSSDPTCSATLDLSPEDQLSPAELGLLLQHDYVYRSSSNEPMAQAGWLAVFVTLGTPEARAFSVAAITAADQGQLRAVAFRQSPTYAGATPSVPLVPGFGIALDIKNMEYKTIDDRDVVVDRGEGSGAALDELKADDTEVNGVLFSQVAQRRPELAEDLRNFKQHLVSQTAAQASEVKVWNMRNIGLAATQRIVQMTQGKRGSFDSAMSKLLDLAQNFPLHAASLTSDALSKELQKEISQRALPSSQWHLLGVGEGMNKLWINGVDVGDPSTTFFDVHEIIDAIAGEQQLAKMFRQLPIPSEEQANLQALAARGFQSSGAMRIDVRSGAKGALHFFNNLEKDSKYKSWDKSISKILEPSWQLPQVAANFYTAIVLLDPSTPTGVMALADALELYHANMPIRIGICIVDEAGPAAEEEGEGDASTPVPALAVGDDVPATARHVARLLQAAKTKYSHKAASTFLDHLSNKAYQDVTDLSESSTFSAAHLVEIFAGAIKVAEKAWRSASYAEDAKAILAGDSYESKKGQTVTALDELYTLAAKFARFKGLQAGIVTMNGMVDPNAANDGSIQGSMNLVLKDMRVLQKMVSLGKLKNGDNILQVLLKKGSFQQYNKDILGSTFNGNPVPFPTAPALLSSSALGRLPFFYSSSMAAKADVALLSFATVSNWDTRAGVELALASLQHIQANGANTASEETNNFFNLHRAVLIDSGLQSSNSSSLQADALAALHALGRAQATTDIMLEGDTSPLEAAIRVLELLLASFDTESDTSEFKSAADRTITSLTAGGMKATDSVTAVAALHSSVVHILFSLEAGANAVVVNGNLVPVTGRWRANDFNLLASLENRYRSRKLGRYFVQKQEEAGLAPQESPALKAGAFASISATLGLYAETARKVQFPDPADFPGTSLSEVQDGMDAVPATVGSGGETTQPLELVAVLDPISEAAQRLVPFLQSLRDLLGPTIRVTVFLNPETEISEFPLERYFRFAAPTRASNDVGVVPMATQMAAGVSFSSLPGHQVLTMKVETPEPWIVPVISAQYDMDNLQLQKCGPDGASVRLALTHLLLTGSCDDHTHGQPPNGLQLQLARAGGLLNTQRQREADAEAYSDTLVMQNLGYYQLKANPGTWKLRLAGRSETLYEILDQGGEPTDAMDIRVRSFGGVNRQLDVRKRPGFEDEELLTASPEEIAKAEAARAAARKRRRQDFGGGGFLDNIFEAMLGGSEADTAVASSHQQESKDEQGDAVATATLGADGSVSVSSVGSDGGDRFDGRIHVFSLASGRVYERLLSIMMVSVSRRASLPVTFWLVENFLSPEFKQNLPKLCETFGFRVELITYKWPHWLRQQTEKQRIIWGYKILFLDVLFPLDLKKVIYVDADQVVRADLKELWDLDLEGHAYGYTPFCDSNKETLGFQFWRQGYWEQHLRGRPYHISALYVVDLVQFRRQAVGDQLRSTYAQLSRDPASLSNLDQDLPNYVQPQVPIFSLPQEWLWCESWCSLESKVDAKTIDLCNHPATKEPKLDMAKRIISGDLFHESWVELDALVAEATESATLG